MAPHSYPLTKIGRESLQLCGNRKGPWTDHILLQDVVLGVDFNQGYVIGPEVGEVLQDAPCVRLVELCALHYRMAKHEAPVAGEIDVHHLDVGIDEADIVLPRKFAANAAIAARIVDRIDLDAFAEFGIVVQMEETPAADQLRRQELADEAFIA